MSRTIKLPIKPALKKYIMKTYDYDPESGPFYVRKHDLIGIALYSLVSLHKKLEPAQFNENVLTEIIELELCQDIATIGFLVKDAVRLNHILDKEFKATMHLFIQAHITNSIPALTGVANFLEFYDVEEAEYSSQSAYRQWLRMSNQEYKKPAKMGVNRQQSA